MKNDQQVERMMPVGWMTDYLNNDQLQAAINAVGSIMPTAQLNDGGLMCALKEHLLLLLKIQAIRARAGVNQ